MKNSNFTKVTAILLCLLMVIPAFLTSAFASSVNPYTSDLPVVTVRGYGDTLHDKDCNIIDDGEVFQTLMSEESLTAIASELAKAVMTKNYDDYCNTIYDIVAPMYDKIRLNEDGEAVDGSHSFWSVEEYYPTDDDGIYVYDEYVFYHDWRIDPRESAKELDKYINAVLEVTGKDKVKLVARCQGATIAMSYLTLIEGAEEKVDTLGMYVPALDGVSLLGAAFSGDIELDSDNIDRYVTYFLEGDDMSESDDMMSLLAALVSILNQVKVLGYGTDILTEIYDAIEDNLIPRLALATFGTFPGYWAMVGDYYFEDAIKFMFSTDEMQTTYAKLIDKAVAYHYDVQVPSHENLKKFEENGMNVFVVAKYNVNNLPIYPTSDEQGDGRAELWEISFGATAGKIDEELPSSYLNKIKGTDREKYLSPDNYVDASTCMFPDKTWFIRDNKHGSYPSNTPNLMGFILSDNDNTVFTDTENYPQYFQYIKSADVIVPLSSSNVDNNKWTGDSMFETMLKFILSIIKMILGGWFSGI